MPQKLDFRVFFKKAHGSIARLLQTVNLLADFFRFGQQRDAVRLAQRLRGFHNSGKVSVGAVQKRQTRTLGGNGKVTLKQNGANALKADGKAHRRNALTQKLADHVVITAAARNGAGKTFAGNFKHHAGIVALAAHQAGRKAYFILAFGKRPSRIQHVRQRFAQRSVGTQRRNCLKRKFAACQKVGQRFHCLGREAFFRQFSANALCADFVELIEADANGIERIGGKTEALQHSAQKTAVVDVDSKAGKADGEQRARRYVNQLDLRIGAAVAQNVDVALHKLAAAAFLRALGAVNAVGLNDFKRAGQLLAVRGIKAGKGQCQVVAQAHVRKGGFIAACQCFFQFVPAFENLENEV